MSKKQPAGINALLDRLEEIAAKSPEFAKLLPEYAKSMLDEFRIQSEHERQMDLHANRMEERALDARTRITLVGQFLGLIIGVTAIIAGTYAAVQGSQWAGAFIGGGGVIGLVSVFVLGRRKPEP